MFERLIRFSIAQRMLVLLGAIGVVLGVAHALSLSATGVWAGLGISGVALALAGCGGGAGSGGGGFGGGGRGPCRLRRGCGRGRRCIHHAHQVAVVEETAARLDNAHSGFQARAHFHAVAGAQPDLLIAHAETRLGGEAGGGRLGRGRRSRRHGDERERVRARAAIAISGTAAACAARLVPAPGAAGKN